MGLLNAKRTMSTAVSVEMKSQNFLLPIMIDSHMMTSGRALMTGTSKNLEELETLVVLLTNLRAKNQPSSGTPVNVCLGS